jgi:polysaccharide export outer membrane protein
LWLLASPFLLLLCPAASAQDPASLTTKQPTQVPEQGLATYVLGPGDTITIRALNVEEISDKPVRIGTSGIIKFPLIGSIKAGGMTLEQLEAEIVSRLKDSVNDPDVAVVVTEYRSQPVSIMGSVSHPGVIQLEGRKTLFEMLSLAGGVNPDAGYSVKITRRSEFGDIPLANALRDPSGRYSVATVNLKTVMEARKPEENILICPFDVISVPKGELIYVIGEVRKSGGFVLNEQETVSVVQALALAGGVDKTAKPGNARILRPVAGSSARVEIPIDLKKVMAGQSMDVPLQSNDILLVPGSKDKKALMQVLQTVVQMGTGVAVWRRY